MIEADKTQPLQERPKQLGDPRDSWNWASGGLVCIEPDRARIREELAQRRPHKTRRVKV
jgi:hypothetical protein